MKRIEFLAPVEAMRGNLSRSKQTLLYADNDNPAWDAPVGVRSYARNYQPIFVGAKVTKTGKKYFAVKTKTAVTITAAAKTRMALLGVSSEIANIIDKDVRLIVPLQGLYMANHPEGWSYKRWLMNYIRMGLKNKTVFMFPGSGSLATVYVKNMYISTEQPAGAVDISEYFPTELRVKFWSELAQDGVEFTIDDTKGIAFDGDDFSNIVNGNYNVLNLAIDSDGYVRVGSATGAYVQDDDNNYVNDSYVVTNGAVYKTTSDTPE